MRRHRPEGPDRNQSPGGLPIPRVGPAGMLALVTAAAVAGFLGLPHPLKAAPQPARRVSELKPGTFLYASPELPDAHFSHTVVVIVTYSQDGAMGLIINRPTEIPAVDAVPDLKDSKGTLRPLYFGGPVDPTRILFMLRGGHPPKESLKVVDQVFLSWTRDTLDESLKRDPSGRNIRMYAGYAGWGPGQLDGEINRGDWVLSEADPETIFADDPAKVWQGVYNLMNRIEVRERVPRPVPASLGRRPDR